jgi:hypothetical protein
MELPRQCAGECPGKPTQCGIHYALQFVFGRQLHMPVPEILAGVVKEVLVQTVERLGILR